MAASHGAVPRYPRRTPVIRTAGPSLPPGCAAADDTHQVRNSLASIISSAECLRRRITDDSHHRYVDDIIHSAREGARSLSILEALRSSTVAP